MRDLQILQKALDQCTTLSEEEKARAQEYLDVQRQWCAVHSRSRAQVRILVTNPEKEWVYAYDLGPGFAGVSDVYQVQYVIHECKQATTRMLLEALNLSAATPFNKI